MDKEIDGALVILWVGWGRKELQAIENLAFRGEKDRTAGALEFWAPRQQTGVQIH